MLRQRFTRYQEVLLGSAGERGLPLASNFLDQRLGHDEHSVLLVELVICQFLRQDSDTEPLLLAVQHTVL